MQYRKRRSPIWTMDKQELIDIVNQAVCIGDILQELGFKNCGGNPRTLKQRLDADSIDYSHLIVNFGKSTKPKYSLCEILVVNSSYNRHTLKRRLIRAGLIENKCYECGLTDNWNNKPITLVLDHINGTHNDNRIENLRLLCPNCNSQTPTFAGRNKKYKYSR